MPNVMAALLNIGSTLRSAGKEEETTG